MSNREVMQQALEALQYGKSHKAISILLKALEQPEQELPPEWLLIKNIIAEYGLDAIAFVAEWKAAQRPWVGLTDAEINGIAKNYALNNPTTPLHFARAIEAALRSKNT